MPSSESSKQARQRILGSLRSRETKPFDAPPAGEYLPVTRIDDTSPDGLLRRFTAEVERLSGQVYVPTNTKAAIQRVIDLVEPPRVMCWDDLPLPGLTEALEARGITCITPHAHEDARYAMYNTIEPIRAGITDVDAAFATTGTLALVTTAGRGRLPSLVPPVHIALLRRDRLVARLEDWLTTAGRAALLDSNSVVFISGPSRTGDIEGQLILGVHGPGQLHIIVC